MASPTKGLDSFHQIVADELSCPICFEDFEEPKALPGCAHNVCKACLSQLVARSGNRPIECPLCRVKSPVSPTGVDGFPTNTLLVRLLDSTPGRKERQAVQNAVGKYNERLNLAETKLENLKKSRLEVQTCLAKGDDLKNEISQYADEIVEQVRAHEKKLCSEVDDCCGHLKDWAQMLSESEKNLQAVMDQGGQCVQHVKDTLMKDDTDEIISMKSVMVDQLQEFVTALDVGDIDVDTEVVKFEMKFEKAGKKSGFELLGKVSSPQQITEVPAKSTDGPAEAAGFFQVTDIHEVLMEAAPQQPEPLPPLMCERNVQQRINFNYQPTSFAVSQNTGDIAILNAKSRQVHHYSANGVYMHTINIKFGNLKDVAFSADECIIVVNHANNRVLYYAKDGIFQHRFFKVYVSDVRIHNVFVDRNGRLILTSTPSDDDSGEGKPCVVVFNADREFSFLLGEGNLDHPYGKALYQNGTFFVPDNGGTVIKLFAENGHYLRNLDTSQCASVALPCMVINPVNGAIFVSDNADNSIKVMNWDGRLMGGTIRNLGDPPGLLQLYHEPRCNCRNNIKVFVFYPGSRFIDIMSYEFP